jgi:hypothetical protein
LTKKPDPDAVAIGRLYAQAQSLGQDTLPLREGEISSDKYRVAVTDADVCHSCRDPFRPPKKKRFVIMDECNHSGGWGLVSICFECFKWGEAWGRDSGMDLVRVTCDCLGCGEPISTPDPRAGYTGAWRWFKWQVCSNRCYQRYRRKRIRKFGGCIDWKPSERNRICDACQKRFVARTDAKFCSNKCRQWHHRRRHAKV